jgi:hypothetical protein
VALADLDADGDMDAVVSCTGFVTVALNRGDGVFVARVDYPAGTVVQTAVADFDGDGRPDLAAANSNETSVTILRNLGGGRFGAGTTIPVGGFLRGIVAADLDHDGDTDLAVCRNGDLRVLANTAGTMSPDLVIPVGYVPRNVAAGDVNADGVPELMTGGEGNDVSVLYRNPDGSYQRQDLGMSIYPITCVVAADLNGDADLDLAGIGSGWVSVRLNQGAGSFDDPTTYEAVPSVKLTAADLDEDGDLDLAVPDGGNNIRLLLNGGNGTFVTQSNVSVPSGARGVAIADLDGSRRDLITGMAPAGFAVLLQTPESRFGM